MLAKISQGFAGMTDAEKLIACMRQIGFEAEMRPVECTEGFRGLAPPKTIRLRIDVGCLFDSEGSLTEYRDAQSGRSVYILPETPAVRREGVVHTLHFRHVG